MRPTLILPVALLIGCSPSSGDGQTNTPVPDGTSAIGTTTDAQGRTSTVYGSDNAAALPKSLPAWVKIYPGAKIVSVLIDTSSAPGGSISYTSPDALAKVVAFQDAALTAAGKKRLAMPDTAEVAVRTVGNDGGSNGGMVTIAREKAMTTVSIIYKN